MPERIAKFLARSGVCSRREAEELIKQGRITVNGETVAAPAFLVDGSETVLFDGERIKSKDKTRLWLYHKPAGLVTSHKDEKGRDTVFAHLPAGLPRVISVGRLDLNSEGLLLLTNDGGLSRALELPSNGWSRRYKVKVHGFWDERRLKKLEKGATVDGIAYGPCKITIDSRPKPAAAPVRNGTAAAVPETAPASRTATNAWLTVSLTEGKNREIQTYGRRRPGSRPCDTPVLRPVPAWCAKTRRSPRGSAENAARTARQPVARGRYGRVSPFPQPYRYRRHDPMRIISGTRRGKKLFAPKNDRIRPTSDRAREALFNILESMLPAPLSEYDFLDVFAGTGAIGLEAASRGARSVTFIDIDLELVKKNAAACRLPKLSYIQKDVRRLPPAARQFNLVFMDAPYNMELSVLTLSKLFEKGWLTDDAIIIVETAKMELLEMPPGLKISRAKAYFYGAPVLRS